MSKYVPRFLSANSSLEDFARDVETELQKISIALELNNIVALPKLTTAPDKPRDGLIVYADGTLWNPGSGEGIYAYYAGSWKKLG